MPKPFTQQSARLVLQTKFCVPPLRPQLVERPRLLDKLNLSWTEDGFLTRLTLVSAPAGFGKTTLVSHWLRSLTLPFAWVSLDEDDNDPTRFLTYMVAALQTLDPALGQTSLDSLQSFQPPSLEGAVAPLINEIMAFKSKFILVLDDYHLITAHTIHQALQYLLDHLPPQLHLVILSRVDPPFSLARLRLRHELTEMRAADLSFTVDEATDFFQRVMRLSVSPDAIARLAARTEGWAAGLQAAALSMRESEHLPSLVETFSGNSRYVLDYLVEEVFRQQTERIRVFLLQTAILDWLSPSLCTAVTGQADARQTLEALDANNLFLVPLDDKRTWYRYHHLFAEFLRDRLQREDGPQVTELHRRASRWHAREDFPAEAIKHALAAKDFPFAVSQIKRVAPAMSVEGEITTLLKWLEALPGDALCDHPELQLTHASCLLQTGSVQSAEAQLANMERAIGNAPPDDEAAKPHSVNNKDRNLLGQVIALRSLAACWSGDVGRAAALSQRALGYLPKGDMTMRSLMTMNIAVNVAETYGARSDLETAIRGLRQAAEQHQVSRNEGTAVSMLAFLGELEMAKGELRTAETTYRRVLELAERQAQAHRTQYPRAGAAHIGLGQLLYEWNHLDRARQHLTEGIALLKRGGNTGDLAFGYVLLARTCQTAGDGEGVLDALRSAEAIAQTSGIAWVTSLVTAEQARLWLAQNQIEAALRWADTCSLRVGEQFGYRREDAYFTLARVLLAADRTDEALTMLLWLRTLTERAGMMRSALRAMVLQALALHQNGDPSGAVTALGQALSLAEPEGYVRLFTDAGAPLAGLLRQAAARGIAVGYVNQLLAVCAGILQPPPPRIPSLIESPTERELEVLRLLAAGLATREIAEELVIATGTVRNHIKRIYSKLDVHSRLQAVERARTLDLL